MKLTGNTVLITGGGSGIGEALAIAFYNKGNKVIIAGRQLDKLKAMTSNFPGMAYLSVDMTSLESISAFAKTLINEHADLNVIINNAGIMIPEDLLKAPANIETAERTVLTNLLGPIRLTSTLLPHLIQQKSSAIMMVTSGLAFVPLAITPTYNATKAALHSYTISLREQLKQQSTEVIEIIPPYVQTELMGSQQASDPHAMPLAAFIDEVMQLLEKNDGTAEIVVERSLYAMRLKLISLIRPLRILISNILKSRLFNKPMSNCLTHGLLIRISIQPCASNIVSASCINT